jgi:hypothetical protein
MKFMHRPSDVMHGLKRKFPSLFQLTVEGSIQTQESLKMFAT